LRSKMKVWAVLFHLFVLVLVLTPVYSTKPSEPVEDEDMNEEITTEAEEEKLTASPNVKTSALFIIPESTTDFPAGKLVRLLISFKNNASNAFLVEAIDGAFKYPQDFTYYIQNFTAYHYNKVIEADREATFEYMFIPSETFASRQFGLTINLRYRNFINGKSFVNEVFNSTVNIVEPNEGFDTETFFLYVFLGGLLTLSIIAGNHLFIRKKGTRSGKSSPKAKNGNTTNGSASSTDIDFEWIPKEHLKSRSSPSPSPRSSPRQSPRLRKQAAGGDFSE